MPKLKSLRSAIGSYGRVSAGGIIEVDDAHADKLLKTNRFVRATERDVADAQKAQAAALTVPLTGATPGFAPAAPRAADATQPAEAGTAAKPGANADRQAAK